VKRFICGVEKGRGHAVLIDAATHQAPRLDIVSLAKRPDMDINDLTSTLDDANFYAALITSASSSTLRASMAASPMIEAHVRHRAEPHRTRRG